MSAFPADYRVDFEMKNRAKRAREDRQGRSDKRIARNTWGSLVIIASRGDQATIADRRAGARPRIQSIEFRRGIVFLITFHEGAKKKEKGKKKGRREGSSKRERNKRRHRQPVSRVISLDRSLSPSLLIFRSEARRTRNPACR